MSDSQVSRVPSENVKNSKQAANGFYFFLYGCFYLSVILYPNKIRDSIFTNGLYFGYFAVIHLLAIYFFLTSGNNPGYLDLTAKIEHYKDVEMGTLDESKDFIENENLINNENLSTETDT